MKIYLYFFCVFIFVYLQVCCFVSFWHLDSCVLKQGHYSILPWWDCVVFRFLGDLIVLNTIRLISNFLAINKNTFFVIKLVCHFNITYLVLILLFLQKFMMTSLKFRMSSRKFRKLENGGMENGVRCGD